MDQDSQIIVTYDVAAKTVSQTHYHMCPEPCAGGMNVLTSYTPVGGGPSHLLALAVYGGPGAPPAGIIDIDPLAGNFSTLVSTSELTVSSPQGAGTFDPTTRTFYVAMLYTNNTPPLTAYYQLWSVDVDHPSLEVLPLMEQPGPYPPLPKTTLWSLDFWATGAK